MTSTLFSNYFLCMIILTTFCQSPLTRVWPTNEERRNNAEFANLRNNAQLYIPFVRLATFTKFPLSEFPRHWCEFPDEEIKTAASRPIFKKLLKEHFFNNLNENFVCERLLCPSCHINL